MAKDVDLLTELRPNAMSVEKMRTLLICRGAIAFETLDIYRRCGWQLPHVLVSSKEWIAEGLRAAPWLAAMPSTHVHYVQEYGDVEAILNIAQAHQIDAIYPGYGFLAESADFADCVQRVGMCFIGPDARALRAVGDKDAAIRLAKSLGIQTLPGDDALVSFAQTHQHEQILAEADQRIRALARQYPTHSVRLKHPAGGGGKGQRVLSAQALQGPEVGELIGDALAKVWAEMGVSALSARKGVLLELNLDRPLHWEVQLFGDGETVVHFAARDCSLQNHASQKFIELALYPGMISEMLQRLDPEQDVPRMASLYQRLATLENVCTAALSIGKAIRLSGAATVEFLVDQQGKPYFLEVNPRIQVEHAVTEGIARVRGQRFSLVELQQRVAAGERLDFQQEEITFVGDAVEVRLNAWHEDFSPVLRGVVEQLRLDLPPEAQGQVRVDAGGLLQRHDAWLIPSYDANFALIVVTGTDRRETLARIRTVLETSLQMTGNTALHTNLYSALGLLTLMQVLPVGTEFRTDTSLLWMACTSIVLAQEQDVLSHLPEFPRQPGACDPARFARLLRATLETAMAHPSRLLTYYLKRLSEAESRPLSDVEVLGRLAEALEIPFFEEERQPWDVIRETLEALWTSASEARGLALQALKQELGAEEAHDLLELALAWRNVNIPAISALIQALESTQLHSCLQVQDDLSLARPAFMQDERCVAMLHQLLSRHLRPAELQDGELSAPMEAIVYLGPKPGDPPFAQIGETVRVGQVLALLEAMKMFTELISPVNGALVDILVVDGQGVKSGTPLFQIVPQDAGSESVHDLLLPLLDERWSNHFRLLSAFDREEAT